MCNTNQHNTQERPKELVTLAEKLSLDHFGGETVWMDDDDQWRILGQRGEVFLIDGGGFRIVLRGRRTQSGELLQALIRDGGRDGVESAYDASDTAIIVPYVLLLRTPTERDIEIIRWVLGDHGLNVQLDEQTEHRLRVSKAAKHLAKAWFFSEPIELALRKIDVESGKAFAIYRAREAIRAAQQFLDANRQFVEELEAREAAKTAAREAGAADDIPTGKLPIKKRFSSGVLICDRCGREDPNAERDEGGWETRLLMTRYTDLCPDCVPKVEAIVRESRRILNPRYMDEAAAEDGDIPF
jgi:hypothetical protein